MKKNTKIYLITAILLLLPIYSMEANNIVAELKKWESQIIVIARAIIGLCSIGGGLLVFFKLQGEEGAGKKAFGAFIVALIFGAMFEYIIRFFLN